MSELFKKQSIILYPNYKLLSFFSSFKLYISNGYKVSKIS